MTQRLTNLPSADNMQYVYPQQAQV